MTLIRYPTDSITLGEGRGNNFIMLLKERRKGDCGNAMNSKRSGTSGGGYTRRPSESECLWKKMIGKPYSGKPNVRFDEGELEIEPFGYLASFLLYGAGDPRGWPILKNYNMAFLLKPYNKSIKFVDKFD
jgi:hypothetical protein